jgi:bifunctional DNase/RNase
MTDMVEVVIDSIRVSLMSQQRIVILREVDDERYLPIWIGTPEAESITIALQEVEVARPLTHDLVKNIVAEMNGRTVNIDSRPSDALALAVRAHVPILVSRSVMDTAGIIPEDDMQEEGEELGEGEAIEASSERLSVFEDFLENLEIDEDGEENDEEEED